MGKTWDKSLLHLLLPLILSLLSSPPSHPPLLPQTTANIPPTVFMNCKGSLNNNNSPIGGCTQTMPQNSISAMQEPVLKAPTTPEIKQCVLEVALKLLNPPELEHFMGALRASGKAVP